MLRSQRDSQNNNKNNNNKKKKLYIALSGLRRSTELSGVTIVIVRERQGWRSHERMTFVSIGNKLTTSQKRRGRPLCRISVDNVTGGMHCATMANTDFKYKTWGINLDLKYDETKITPNNPN